MSRLSTLFWVKVLGMLPGEVSHADAASLLSPGYHMSLLASRRAHMLVGRVRLFACLFSILTPLWIVVDCYTLPSPLWWQLAALRLATSAAFLALTRRLKPDGTLWQAWRGMALLFAIPSLFYLCSHLLLMQYSLAGVPGIISAGYSFLPFVLLAGLAIFPLTLLECAAFALPALLAHLLSGYLLWQPLLAPSFWGAFWLQVLIAAVAALACTTQLAFMMALVQQAVRDPLTGVFSRRSGEEMLELLAGQAARNAMPLTVVFIDLDHFKTINDRFGHAAGDQTLKRLASHLDALLRHSDILCRWGGEEFLLLLPNTSLVQARALLRRLRRLGLGERPDKQPLTASMGVAEWQQDAAGDWRQLLAVADARMYQAKAAGRDRVEYGGRTEAA
ncbi:sensor domain-containing diguanylate cyclase [Vogesella urethralis]|uniref:GGDEF domain-containing protein n=1 Tax=Vogesella urethralis TaxID=2592656 RepID=UPI0011851423|nr:GGDEF domain-containing protein [Vogesella urethralis]MEC5207011.1 diguanylate cyclase (GGDEF)-like protein [Vogesella perlucida]